MGYEMIGPLLTGVEIRGSHIKHNLKLVNPRSKSCLRQNVFSQRVTNEWNGLAADVD